MYSWLLSHVSLAIRDETIIIARIRAQSLTKALFQMNMTLSVSFWAYFWTAFCSITLASLHGQAIKESGWKLTQVPGKLEAPASDGYSWFRCYVRVPDDWTSESTSVFSETVSLNIENASGAHEAYVNSTKIGGVGMPPNFRSTRNETNSYKVPKGVLKAGQFNVIAIRIYSPKEAPSFSGRPPILAGYFQECVLKGDWEYQQGDDIAWAANALKEPPHSAIFENFTDATSTLQRPEQLIHGKKLLPEESLRAMRPADDLEINLVMSEPLVAQPLSLRFDEKGRLWVVQYRQYPYPNGIRMVSRDKHYRAVYDGVPSAPPNHVHGSDRVTVHEDTDQDGTFDKHMTFVDNLNIATSALPGRGGVWILNPPYLLFYPDANNDCVPDGDPIVHLEGFGLEDVHSVVNNLTWGPDGWIYGAQGSTVSSHVDVKIGKDFSTSDANSVYCEGAAIWRYHPETHKYEIFAEGGGNAFGIEFDSQGRLFTGHNGGDTRGYLYMQGGYYDKGDDSKYGTLSNLYAFGMLSSMSASTPIKRFSHALVQYEDDSLPRKYHGKIFAIDPLNRNVVLSEKIPEGASFSTNDLGYALASEDPSFRPVAIVCGPNGAIYIADFCEEFIAHGQHYHGQIDPTSGRIYRLQAKGKHDFTPIDLSEKTTGELVDLLGHHSKWHRQTALRLLNDRQDTSVNTRLRSIVNTEKGQLALEAFWALNLLGGFDSSVANVTLCHDNPSIRSWTVRILGDKQYLLTKELSKQLASLAESETEPDVRSQLAATARRLPASDCLSIVQQLWTHDEDVDDPIIPLMLWWALESTVDNEHVSSVDIFHDQDAWEMALVAEGIAEKLIRRYASSGTRDELLSAAKLFELAPDEASQKQLLKGFDLAFAGRSLADIPEELAKQLDRLSDGSLTLSIRQGDHKAIDQALKTLTSQDATTEEQIEILRVLGEVKNPSCLVPLLDLLKSTKDVAVRNATLVALQNYDSPIIAQSIIELYNSLPSESALVAVATLASRAQWSRLLLEAIENDLIKQDSISLESVRRMSMHQDDVSAAIIAKHWKSLEGASSQQMKEQMLRAEKLVASGGGNPYAGEKMFLQCCAACHTLFGRGGHIGPDLTAYKRDDSSTMLLNIINPSAEIREGFENYLVLTDEGRAITGFLFDQDKRVVVIRGADGQNVTIPRDTIDEMIRQPLSLMPENLLDKLTDEQIRDLFAYLRSSQPVSK